MAQQPKQEGGLGVRDLATHNACLLLKLLHRLHHPEDSAWAIWARRSTDMISMKGPADGNHWEGLQALLPAYRIPMHHQRAGGRRCFTASTSSWWDSWLGAFTLAVQFPCLLSHSTNKDVSVQQIIQLGISYNLTA